MKTNAKMMAIGLILAAVVIFSSTAIAGTAVLPGGSATTDLTFRVSIPKFVFFRISGAPSEVVFTGTLNDAETGDISYNHPSVTVDFITNNTTATIAATGSGAITNITPGSAGGTIDWSEFSFTSTEPNLFPTNAINGVEFDAFSPTPSGTYISNYTSTWEFTFDDPTGDYEGGNYEGTLTYTITNP